MPDAFDDMLKALSAEYRGKLPARLAEVQRLWALAPSDAGSLAVLRRELHTMAGSASTFGLPGLTLAARAAEQRLDAVIEHEASLNVEELSTLLETVQQAAGLPPA
jgi:chemotaxis protein histidine kinase CheA